MGPADGISIDAFALVRPVPAVPKVADGLALQQDQPQEQGAPKCQEGKGSPQEPLGTRLGEDAQVKGHNGHLDQCGGEKIHPCRLVKVEEAAVDLVAR